MQCPVCKLDLVIVEVRGVELDMCIEGHGIWFDADELRQLFLAAGVPESLQTLEEHLADPPPGDHGARRRCLRCGRRMKHVAAPGPLGPAILDQCVKGHGLWFDDGELEQVLRGELEEGDEAIGRVLGFLRDFGGPAEEGS